MTKNKKIILIVIAAIVFLLLLMGLIKLMKKAVNFLNPQPKFIVETISLPLPKKILPTSGRMVVAGPVQTPIDPKNDGEKIIVPAATLTAKGVYNLALPEAQKWSPGVGSVKLVFIKSIGALTLDGKSDGWQIVFGSKLKKGKNYEIIMGGDKIISQRETASSFAGADLPASWRDSDVALIVLRQTAYFSDATVSSINFFYNTDSKTWQYAFNTSKGTTTLEPF